MQPLTLFCQACLQRVIEEKILPFTMHNRLQCSTVHYAGGRHHGDPCCRPHGRHICHAQSFLAKELLVLLRCVAGWLLFVGPAYATIDTLFVRLVYKGS